MFQRLSRPWERPARASAAGEGKVANEVLREALSQSSPDPNPSPASERGVTSRGAGKFA